MAQREIKFREWDKSMGRYLDPNGILGNPNAFFYPNIVIYPNGHVFELDENDAVIREATDEMILEQYVEMYDEEDISIYDGDVIKVWDNGIGQVVYENGVFKVDFKDGRKYPLELWWQDFISGKASDNPFKVLGNIHQNPEFLEAE